MELFTYGLQISAMIVSVVFLVALLLQGVISLFVRLDRRLTRSTAPQVAISPQELLAPSTELSPELLAVIIAAVEVATDKKIRVKSIRYRRQMPGSSWIVQGRAAIMASHKVKP